jgi:hypothetical protein
MNIDEKTYELLSAAGALPSYGSPVTQLVPATRIKPPGDWQTLTRPYVVHFSILTDPTETHDNGRSPFTGWTVQVSVFALGYREAMAVVTAVKAILEASANPKYFWVGQSPMPYEHDVKVQQIVLEFAAWEVLSLDS